MAEPDTDTFEWPKKYAERYHWLVGEYRTLAQRLAEAEAQGKTFDALDKVIKDIQAEPMDSKLERAWDEAKRWRARAERAEAALRDIADRTFDAESQATADAALAATPTEEPER